MIRDEQGVRPQRPSQAMHPGTDDPGSGAQKTWGPRGTAAQRLGDHMNRPENREEADEPSNPQDRKACQARAGLIDRG